MKKRIYIILVIALFLSSCKKEEYKAPVSNTVEMSGTWWVKLLYLDDGEYRDLYEDLGYGDIWGKLITTNTASNDDSLWIIDTDANDYIWEFQSKVKCSTSDLTFSNPNAISIVPDYEIATPITNGRILKAVATTPGGNTSDSIVMDIQFEDLPGFDLRIAGYKRTGWPEDDH